MTSAVATAVTIPNNVLIFTGGTNPALSKLNDGKPVALTPIEFRLLAVLARHAGQVLSPEQLLEQAWNDPLRIGPDRVKFSILRLRKKLGWHSAGSPIEAVRGFGYRYVPPPG